MTAEPRRRSRLLNLIIGFIKSPIGKKVAKGYSIINARIEQEYYRSEFRVDFDEKLSREEFFAKAMRFLQFNRIEGDYLEFGCFGGMTFGLAHKYKHTLGLNMKLYAFDSFQGLPKPEGIDVHAQWKEGAMAMGMAEFIEKLEEMGVEKEEYFVVPGFYDESLKRSHPGKIGLEKAALVYIDCDLYESTVPPLNYVLPILQTGTILAFDDFFCFNGDPDRGGQLALKEFLQKNPQIKISDYLNIGWSGKSFIVKTYATEAEAKERLNLM
jgi:hypothetical protein